MIMERNLTVLSIEQLSTLVAEAQQELRILLVSEDRAVARHQRNEIGWEDLAAVRSARRGAAMERDRMLAALTWHALHQCHDTTRCVGCGTAS